jgi:uncharacterized protein (TIGR03435 family)
MKTECTWDRRHFRREVAPGLRCCAAGAMALLLAANGAWVRAQAAPPAQTSAPATQPAAPASPTDIVGTWQGTLHIAAAAEHPEINLRIVNKISKNEKGELKVADFSIDQGGQPMMATTASFQNGVLNYAIENIGGKYEGTMSADGKTINGTWSQGPTPLPLNLERANADTAWEIPKPPKAMAADANPSFEVATIKPNNSGATQMQALIIRGRNFITRASSVKDLLSFAYNVQAKQILNGPAWMEGDRFDINALPDAEGVPNSEQIRVMIQKLLADRFALKFHHEQREMEAYVLEVGKTGAKMPVNESKAQLPGLGFRPGPTGITLMAGNATMSDLTGFLQVLVLDRPVVDRTGLTARYDLKCTFTPDDSQFNGHPPKLPDQTDATAVTPAPGLYQAVQDELGLKLTAEKTAVDVIVIDHLDHFSPN